jgi:hypothetical protein
LFVALFFFSSLFHFCFLPPGVHSFLLASYY